MKRIIVLAVVALALAFVAIAGAATPVVSSVSATGTERTSNGTTVDSQQVSVAWSLGQGEYACTLKVTSPDAQQIVVLSSSSTGANVSLPAAAGSTITVDLEWSNAAGPAIDASNACNVSRSTSSTSTTAQAYTPPAAPAPAPAPPAPAPAPRDPSSSPAAPVAPVAEPTTTTASTSDVAALQARLDDLDAKVADLQARVDRLDAAVVGQTVVLSRRLWHVTKASGGVATIVATTKKPGEKVRPARHVRSTALVGKIVVSPTG